MKLFFALMTLISLTTVAQATHNELSGQFDEVFCGEVSPKAVGDACIVLMTTKDQKKMGLLLDFNHWLTFFPASGDAPESFVGKKLSAFLCEAISDEDTLEVLADFNADYTYVTCNPDNVFVEAK